MGVNILDQFRKPDDNQKLLIEIIKRFDGYINVSNNKVAIILSYCMAYIGGLGFKLVDIAEKREHDWVWWSLLCISLISVIVTLWAARFAYRAIAPQVTAGRAPHEPPSVIFFGDVADHPGGRDGYANSIVHLTDEVLVRDLSNQAYVLSLIAASKFSLINESVRFLVHFQIPCFAIVLVVLLTGLTYI